jgi:menaquinone-9 beta-reductase
MTQQITFERSYDALIVGARPAGAATAMLLARQGLKVLAIDRQDYGSDTLSTHALMRGSVLQLVRWGLLDKIIEAETPPICHTSFFYDDEEIGIDSKPEYGVDALYAPRRTVLDRVLVDGARAAGAQIQHGANLTELAYGRDGRVIGASIKDADGVEHTISSDIVIGADGRHSTVARSVNAEIYRELEHRTAILYSYFAGMKNEGFRWYFRAGVAVGVIPTNDGNTSVFVALPPERYRREVGEGTEVLFTRIVAEISLELAAEIASARRVEPLRGFAGTNGYFRQSNGSGWALVGDAGYFKDPLTAHGITDALRDAEFLSSAVSVGSPASLQNYQAERDALSNVLFEVTDEIASFNWSIDELKNHHRILSKAMKSETAALAARAVPLPPSALP